MKSKRTISIQNARERRKKMKKNTINLTLNAIIGFLLMSSLALAGDHEVIFTFGESGQAVSFEMSDEEIITHNEKLMGTSATPLPSYHQFKSWADTFEMSESGIVFVFELSKEEIELAKANTSKEAEREMTSKEEDSAVSTEKFEMAESGLVIEFRLPEKAAETKVTFAEKKSVTQ
jgi:hypothetical protein